MVVRPAYRQLNATLELLGVQADTRDYTCPNRGCLRKSPDNLHRPIYVLNVQLGESAKPPPELQNIERGAKWQKPCNAMTASAAF